MTRPRIHYGPARPGFKLYAMRWTKSGKLSGFGIRALHHRIQLAWW